MLENQRIASTSLTIKLLVLYMTTNPHSTSDVCPYSEQQRNKSCAGGKIFLCLPTKTGKLEFACFSNDAVSKNHCPIAVQGSNGVWKAELVHNCNTSERECPTNIYQAKDVYNYHEGSTIGNDNVQVSVIIASASAGIIGIFVIATAITMICYFQVHKQSGKSRENPSQRKASSRRLVTESRIYAEISDNVGNDLGKSGIERGRKNTKF